MEENPRIIWKIPLIKDAKQKLPKVMVRIQDKISYNAMIDTGAEKSIITLPEAIRIWGKSLQYKIKPWHNNMLAADNRGLEVMGAISTRLQMGRIVTYVNLIIIKSQSEEILLGYDFLTTHKLSIIEDKYVAHIELGRDNTKPEQEEKYHIFKVSSMEEVILQPHQSLTPVKVRIHVGRTRLNGRKVVISTEDSEGGLEPHELACIPTIDTVVQNSANILMHNKDYPCERHILEGDIIGAAWQYDKHNEKSYKVRRILEHLDKETKFYDNLTLDEEVEPETIGLEDLTKIDIKEAIEEANIVNKTYMSRIKEILHKHKEAISTHAYDLGKYNVGPIKIKMNDLDPVHVPYRAPQPQLRNKAREILNQLVRADIITPGYAPWTAQIRWVVKPQADDHSRIPGQKINQKDKDPDLRMAIDYSHMRDKVAKQQYPIVPVKKILPLLRDKSYVTSIDLRKAFWQIEICDESKMIWAFEGCEEAFLHNRLPMGTQVSQQILSHCLQRSLQGCETFAISYSDNVLIFSKTAEDHLEHLDKTLAALKKYGWKISANKSHIMSSEDIILFGFKLNLQTGTIEPDPDKVIRIQEMQPPKDRKGIRRFLGSLMYYADLIANIGEDLANLQDLLKTNIEYKWLPKHQEAFENVKTALAAPNFVVLPDFSKDFHIVVDAGPTYVGGGVFQHAPEILGLRPVAFWYKKLSSVEQRYSQIEKEALALVAILKTHAHILLHGYSIIYTDAKSLTFLKCFEASPKLQRWNLFIQSFPHSIMWSSKGGCSMGFWGGLRSLRDWVFVF